MRVDILAMVENSPNTKESQYPLPLPRPSKSANFPCPPFVAPPNLGPTFKRESRADTEAFKKQARAETEAFKKELLAGDERLRKRIEEVSTKMEKDTETFKRESRADTEAFKKQARADTEAFKKEVSGKIEKLSERMSTDTQAFKREVSAETRRLGENIGEISNKMGTFMEDMVAPNIPRILRRYFDDPEPDFLAVRLKKRTRTIQIPLFKALRVAESLAGGPVYIGNDVMSRFRPPDPFDEDDDDPFHLPFELDMLFDDWREIAAQEITPEALFAEEREMAADIWDIPFSSKTESR